MKKILILLLSIIPLLSYGKTSPKKTNKADAYSKPVMITTRTIWKDEEGNEISDGDEEQLSEYCKYDAQGRIAEYGCITGQYDYEGYIRMFKINYKGEKIDSVQWKEVYFGMVNDKKDLILRKGVSIYDNVTGENIGFTHDADKKAKDLNPKSIESMRQYADSKNDILERQFGRQYEFSSYEWDKQKNDAQGRPTYTEIKQNFGDDEYSQYKVSYTYGKDYVKKRVNLKQRRDFGGDVDDMEYDYIITEKY